MSDEELDSREFIENPFPFYARWREDKPFWWSEKLGGWVVSRHDDVKKVISDFRTFRQSPSWDRALIAMLGPETLMAQNGDAHRKLRRAIADLFRPKVLQETLTPLCENLAAELIEPLGDRFELCSQFLRPFVGKVHSRMMGTGEDDELYDQYNALMDAYSRSRSDGGTTTSDDIIDAAKSLLASMGDLLDQKRDKPGDDVMSELLQRDLNRAQAINMSAAVMMAGIDTSLRGIANTFFCLSEQPDADAKVKADHSLAPKAFEESLRLIGVVQIKRREVADKVTLYDKELTDGDQVVALMGSATRDSRQYSDPDIIDFDRENSSHIAFGAGPHLCIGAPVARVLANTGIKALLDRYPELTVDKSETIDWEGPVRRGPKALWMTAGSP